MRVIPAALQTHLDGRITTICRCFKITLSDNTVLGFTDHDRTLSFDGVDYKPQDAYSITTYQQRMGLSVDAVDISAAISATSLTQDDIDRGLYDNATLEVFIVNWEALSQRITLFKGLFGDVTRGKLSFDAEIRSIAHKLNQSTGRIYSHYCDAVLGDTRCKKDISASPFHYTGSVDSITDNQNFIITGFTQNNTGWFDYGRLTFTSGLNDGITLEIKSHVVESGDHVLKLWLKPPFDVAVSDTVILKAGCKKSFTQDCVQKFDNAINFQGFPDIPNMDAIIKNIEQLG